MILQQIYNIQETVYKISSESPEFYRRYYKKHFGLLFSEHSVLLPQWIEPSHRRRVLEITGGVYSRLSVFSNLCSLPLLPSSHTLPFLVPSFPLPLPSLWRSIHKLRSSIGLSTGAF